MLERDHHRPREAQPSGDASQVSAQKRDFSSQERTDAYAEEATGGHSGVPSGPYCMMRQSISGSVASSDRPAGSESGRS